ncbi:hypothetical protein FH972_024823 [Carpinus fangiana]|uniref:Uncharacterized protein n=1 Tax=Carpinus fangiana TaxID=176857 RepID=A0A5N6KZF7_9ROSI|nr:hypothetical protein FH972_024823 [Carpinus fangiana]
MDLSNSRGPSDLKVNSEDEQSQTKGVRREGHLKDDNHEEQPHDNELNVIHQWKTGQG